MATIVRDGLIRMNRKGEEEEVNRLFNLIFNEARPLEGWRWKFGAIPGGPSLFSVAEVEGKIVGQYPSLTLPFTYEDKLVLGTQPVDSMVHPDFRAGGTLLLKMLANQVAFVEEQGVAFGLGFPNAIHYRVGKRLLKYKDLFPLPILFRRLNWRQAVKRRIPRVPRGMLALVGLVSGTLCRLSLLARGSGGNIVIREVPAFDERIDALWKIVRESYGILMVRDRQFLNWRYVANPSHRYTILIGENNGAIVGYSVLWIRQDGDVRVGEIADILTIDNRAAERAIISGALQWFLSRKTDFVLCYVLKEDRISRTLAKYGFQEHPAFPPLPLVYQIYSAEIDEGFFKDPRNWHLTHGDSLDTV